MTNYSKLTVGQRVSIVGYDFSIAIFTVTRKLKSKIVLTEVGGSQVYEFSLTTGRELSSKLSELYIETIEDMEARISREKDRRHEEKLWESLKDAVNIRRIDLVVELVNELKSYGVL